MTIQNEGQRVLWMVWGLVAVAFVVGLMTLGVIGWTLSSVRAERSRLVEQERQLVKTSDEVSRLALEGREEIETLLSGEPVQAAEGRGVRGLRQLMQQQGGMSMDDALEPTWAKLASVVAELEELRKRAAVWQDQYEVASRDLRETRTLSRVRGLLHKLGAAVETLEGKQRLLEAIQHRRWQAAEGVEKSRLAEAILKGQGLRGTALRGVRSELADVARLVEELAGEQQIDNLTNVKDNKLKPSLQRLSRSTSALSNAETVPAELAPETTEALYVALFGKGYVIDEAHQTVRVGRGGLYALRSQILRLRQEKEHLQEQLQTIYGRIDEVQDTFSNRIQDRAKTLAKAVEEQLADVWDNMLIVGGISFAGFLGLAWMISGGIGRGVRTIEDARAAADESNRTTQRLLLEQQAAAEALRKAEENYHSIFDNAVEGIYQSTPGGMFLRVNPALARMYGYEGPDDMVESIKDIASQVYVHSHDRDKFTRMFAEQGRVHGLEYQVYRRDGTVLWVSENARAVRGEGGGLLYYEGTIQDITARKQAQEELHRAKEAADAANRAKSDFLASMSHELRTPLNGILGYAQILRRDASLSEKQRSGVEVIQRSGDHLLTLINDILDLSKIEAQKLELQLTEFHLPDFLQQISNIIRVRAEQAELSFIYEPVSALPIGVRGDEKRLRQVLLNLLGNAVKFTEKGGVALKVGYDDAAEGRTTVRFQVEDTGRGIPADKLDEIFQPFQQVSDQSRQVEGTGLGLAITKKLVGLMGGKLGVTSTPGKGSTFWFTADLPAVEVGRVAVASVERTITGYKGVRKRILVVDDKPENRGIVVNLLDPLGFEVDEAVNGQEGLAKISERRPDLIFMDLVMPVMDGIEATRRIRQSPESKDIVVIASTASAFDFNRQDSLRAGCNDFLPKPVRAEELFEKLRTHLSLEWVYESDPNAGEPQPAARGGTLVAPPQEELRTLVDLAKKGKIMGIREGIAKIEQLGPEYRPFAAELGRLAKSFDMDQLKNFLASYLEGTP